ncbi:hypothetical protein GCM10007916_29030 [Psychromonas marina]|uniref:Uncharacterized protein n=1 Tax=Psychromonas marina TaxID=88364 RepID=A0ABQ6E351_9GAMM|nr:hypothetical protein GCM10007916_29030 [Psychromonas marina]
MTTNPQPDLLGHYSFNKIYRYYKTMLDVALYVFIHLSIVTFMGYYITPMYCSFKSFSNKKARVYQLAVTIFCVLISYSFILHSLNSTLAQLQPL